jgi:hypothetical protein
MGVKPEMTRYGTSPLVSLLISMGLPDHLTSRAERQHAQIETLRLLLYRFDQVDDWENSLARDAHFIFSDHLHLVEWFWNHAAVAFDGLELNSLRAKLVQELIASYVTSDDINNTINELLIRLIDNDVLEMYRTGRFSLLPWRYIWYYHRCWDSVGTAFLNLISALKLDVAMCMNIELQDYPGGVIWDVAFETVGHQIVLEGCLNDGWVLRCERVCRVGSPGYEVMSAFKALAIDHYDDRFYCPSWECLDWPFRDHSAPHEDRGQPDQEQRRQMERFNRRMAAKARKERARNGEKRPRSRMPGAWNW